MRGMIEPKARRELFVGNLPPGKVTELSLHQVFHIALTTAFPLANQTGQEPVVKVSASRCRRMCA